MSIDKVKTLMDLMKQNEIATVEYEEKDFKVKLEKYPAGAAAAPVIMPTMPNMAVPAAATPAPTGKKEDEIDMTGLTPVKSPIVGTFYASPSPDSAPFVAVGDKVTSESIVCIIEAMKIMNEIKAEVSGTIEKMLVENGEPVEYGQPLFLVRK